MFTILTLDLYIAPVLFTLMILFMAGALTVAMDYEPNGLSKLVLKAPSVDECWVFGGIASLACVLIYNGLYIAAVVSACLLAAYGLVRWCHETYVN